MYKLEDRSCYCSAHTRQLNLYMLLIGFGMFKGRNYVPYLQFLENLLSE